MPVLCDGDVVLYESMAIVSYLEAKYPARRVLGRTPEETGQIWRMWSECVFYFEATVDRVVLPVYQGTAKEQADAVRAAARDVTAELTPIEARLARSPWLVGDEPTAADGAFVPQIGHLLRALSKPIAQNLDLDFAPFASKFPAVSSWWDRCRALPGFERTYPPHWR